MSQCFRNVSNKFTTVNSLLNTTRKHVARLDRHRIKPSTFLEEFLNTRTITSAAVSQKCKLQAQDQPLSSSSSSPSLALLNNCEAWREAFDKEYDDAEEEKMKIISSINPIMISGIKKYEISSDDIVSWEKLNSKNIRWDDFNSNSMNSNSKSLITHQVECLEKTYNRLSNGITMLKTNDSILSDFEKNMILLSENGKLNAEKIDTKQQSAINNEGKPSQEQLQHVYDVLSRTLPSLFLHPLDYSIYHKDVHFVNNIRGTVTRGLLNYIKQMAVLRTIGHLRFAYVKFEIIKMTMNPEDDSIKIRWRITGISGLKAFFFFWKVKLWKMSESYEQQELWYDGFSTFHVNGDGLVYKHVADKVMPDKDETVATKDQTAVAAKLALFLGLLVPGGETLSEIYPLSSISSRDNNFSSNKLVTHFNCDKIFLLETDLITLEEKLK